MKQGGEAFSSLKEFLYRWKPGVKKLTFEALLVVLVVDGLCEAILFEKVMRGVVVFREGLRQGAGGGHVITGPVRKGVKQLYRGKMFG